MGNPGAICYSTIPNIISQTHAYWNFCHWLFHSNGTVSQGWWMALLHPFPAHSFIVCSGHKGKICWQWRLSIILRFFFQNIKSVCSRTVFSILIHIVLTSVFSILERPSLWNLFFLCGICVTITAVHKCGRGKWLWRDVWHFSFILLVIGIYKNAWVDTLSDIYSSAHLRSLKSNVWYTSPWKGIWATLTVDFPLYSSNTQQNCTGSETNQPTLHLEDDVPLQVHIHNKTTNIIGSI